MATRSSMWSSSDDVILLHTRSTTSEMVSPHSASEGPPGMVLLCQHVSRGQHAEPELMALLRAACVRACLPASNLSERRLLGDQYWHDPPFTWVPCKIPWLLNTRLPVHALRACDSTSQCLDALQKPWLQAGTSRLLASEVSATVADDIADLQQQGLSVSDAFLSPRPSRIGKLLSRCSFWLHLQDRYRNTPISPGRTAILICKLKLI